MPKTLASLIKVTDLELMKHLIVLRNDMSGLAVIDEDAIRILEFREKGIVIITPENICAEKHKVTLAFVSLPIKKKVTTFAAAVKFKDAFEVIGKVVEVTKSPEFKGQVTLSIEFTQYNIKDWKALIVAYIERQNSINRLKPNHGR